MWVLLVREGRPEERRGVRLRYGNAAPFDAKGRELSIDKPIPTVMGLNEMHNGHQFIIENDGEPVAPAPIAAKPPYRVPLMPEIAALPPNGLSIVSTFSGAGGSCLGFRLAGFRTLWANEFVEAARETYEANHPGVPVDGRSIRDVTAEEILAATGLARGELDVLEGSPPCASFSTAGKRSQHWGQTKSYSDTTERTDDLFFEFVRLLDGLKPRAFVAENVSGLVKGVAKGYFKEILRALRGAGYVVEAKLLDAQWLGVPQARQRIIFAGVREGLGRSPAFPKPLSFRYSIRDALPHLSTVDRGKTGGHFGSRGDSLDLGAPIASVVAGTHGAGPHQFEVGDVGGYQAEIRITGRTEPGFRRVESELDEPINAIIVSDPAQTRYEVEVRKIGAREEVGGNVAPSLDGYAVGAEWDRLAPGESSEKYLNLSRPHADKPVPTVTALGGSNAGVASVTHPTERRKFTIGELRRLCSFPDDFYLSGTYA
jgi:DNA (cytosine-5)-methyltransferase 1